MTTTETGGQDQEIQAISQVHAALRELSPDAQQRVLDYVAAKFSLNIKSFAGAIFHTQREETPRRTFESSGVTESEGGRDEPNDDLGGISPIAQKWMRRSDLSSDELSRIFSLGIDEIDLVAKRVPGNSRRDKTRSVILLKGVATYLGSGVARVSHEAVKEACLHYDAWDSPNFAKYLRTMASEVSGTKESGYTLTARGMTEATQLVRDLLAAGDKT